MPPELRRAGRPHCATQIGGECAGSPHPELQNDHWKKPLSLKTKPALHPWTNSDTIRETTRDTIRDTIVRYLLGLWTRIEKMRPVLRWDKLRHSQPQTGFRPPGETIVGDMETDSCRCTSVFLMS